MRNVLRCLPWFCWLCALAVHLPSAAGALTLTSPAFTNGAAIPAPHTCDGADISPALRWSDTPTGTKSLALIVEDPDAPSGTWVHWVLYEMPATRTELAEGVAPGAAFPDGTKQGKNDFHKLGYGGPCPPGGKAHRYFFKLYALDAPTGLASGASKADVVRATSGHVLGQAELMGKFEKQ